jgi:hypothetical protein
MKKLILIAFIFGNSILYIVKAQDNPVAVRIAGKIAQQMKDSLSLTDEQKMQVFNINMDLYRQKKQLRDNTTLPDTLEVYLQQIENKRDGLYKAILLDEEFKTYKLKKRFLLKVD